MARIREELTKAAPEFVVMYGVGQKQQWERILGLSFDTNGISRRGRTVAAMTHHPVTRGLSAQYWVDLGKVIREKHACFDVSGPVTAS